MPRANSDHSHASGAELRCPQVLFFSHGDEASFFQWAQSIPSVVEVFGQGREIILRLRSKRVSSTSLRELLALFHRYRIPMRQFRAFHSEQNASWFASPSAYWYKSVFRNVA